MVRLKNRYLLVDILYPDPVSWPSAPTAKTTTPPTQVRIHAPTSDALTPGLLARMVREEVAAMYGDWGVGRLGGAGAGGVTVKYLSTATSTAIIRCPRASFRLVWTALTYMSHVPDLKSSTGAAGRGGAASLNRPCVFRVVRLSGTMRKVEEEAIRRARREIVRLKELDEGAVLDGLLGGHGQSQKGKPSSDDLSAMEGLDVRKQSRDDIDVDTEMDRSDEEMR